MSGVSLSQTESDRRVQTNILLELVRASVLQRMPAIPNDVSIDWDKLMDLSQEQGLIAWVWDGVCKLPPEQQPPRQYRINWGLSAQEIWDRYELQKSVLQEIVAICKNNHMRLMLLKGLALSDLFPNPHSRPSGDIDIYLFEDFEKGNKLFSSGQCPETELHTSFEYRGVEIENHKIFVYNNSKVKGMVGEYLLDHTNDVVLSPHGYYTFAPLPNLVYLLMHALNHVNYASEDTIFSLKHILDLGLFVRQNRSELPPDRVLKTIKELRLAKSFELIVYLSEWLLGDELKEYHCNIIKVKDLCQIRVLFENLGLSIPLPHHTTLLKQSIGIWGRYRELRPVSKYIPKKPKNGLLRVSLHEQKLSIIRHVFTIPDEGSKKANLKERFFNKKG